MLDLAEKIEGAINGLVSFLFSACRTVLYGVLFPKRFGERLARTPKFFSFATTFLTLSTFIVVKLFRAIVFAALVLSFVVQNNCHGEDSRPGPFSQYAETIFSWPSLDDILIIGLPIILVTLGIASLLRRCFARRPGHGEHDHGVVADLVCYIVGLQYLVLVPLGLALGYCVANRIRSPAPQFLTPMLRKITGNDGNNLLAYGALVMAGCVFLITILWAAVMFYRALTGIAVLLHTYKARRKSQRVAALAIAALVATVPLGTTLLITYPLAQHDFDDLYLHTELIRVGLVNEKKIAACAGYDLTLQIENPSETPVHLNGESVEIASERSSFYHGSFTKARTDDAWITLAAHSSVVVHARVSGDGAITEVGDDLESLKPGSHGRIRIAGVRMPARSSFSFDRYAIFNGELPKWTANFVYGEFNDRNNDGKGGDCDKN